MRCLILRRLGEGLGWEDGLVDLEETKTKAMSGLEPRSCSLHRPQASLRPSSIVLKPTATAEDHICPRVTGEMVNGGKHVWRAERRRKSL